LRVEGDQIACIGNILRAALWGVEDESHLDQEYYPIRTLCNIRKDIVKWYESFKIQDERIRIFPLFQKRFTELSNCIHEMIFSYESKLERLWNDSRAGTVWKDGSQFEPHSVIVEKNRTLNDGVDRYSMLISGETIKTFRFIACGLSNVKPNPGQWGLADEAFRNLADYLTGNGNVVKMGMAIPKGVPTASFKEFGGCDEPTDPSTFNWRVRIKNAPFLEHIQGLTNPQVNHTTYLVVEKTV